MQQGDQYSIMLAIQKDGHALTPDDVVGVKVSIAGIEQSYPGNGLTYDETLECWLFPVTQAQTLAMSGQVPAQVQVNLGGNPPQIIGSTVSHAYVNKSIIGGVWGDA